MKAKKVVIVGAGLGGLQCGYILSKEGYNVTIVEKNNQIGGCLQTFVRNGCVFDAGVHYFGSMGNGEPLNYLFNYFGLTKKLNLKKLDTNAFDVIDILGNKYNYAQGFDNFSKTLTEYFPQEKNAITLYTNKLVEIGEYLNKLLKGNITRDANGMLINDYFYQNTFNFINSLTNNEKLRNVLAGLNTLYTGVPDSSPLYTHGIINYSLIQSAWRVVDGGNVISKALSEQIIKNGGKIIINSEVVKFINDSNNNITHVKLKNNEEITADYFISNINPASTIKLTDANLLRAVYKNRINSLEQTFPMFSLYIVFKENAFKYFNYNYYRYNNQNVWGSVTYSENTWPEGYMMYTPATSKPSEFAESMIVLTYMKYSEVAKWESTSVGKRGQEYNDFKANKAEKLISEISKIFPDIKNKIKTYYTSTPLTYRDYTGTINGSAYGILKDSNNPLRTYILPRTKIHNLLLTGQNINIHGILGVSVGSILTCAEFVGFDYLLKKVKDAQ